MRVNFYILSFLIITSNIFAIQAIDEQIVFRQPDGIEFSGHVRGDEWRNWHETVEGYTIAKDSEGFWRYVQDVNSEEFILSSIPAHSPMIDTSIKKYIKPIKAIRIPDHEHECGIDFSELSREEFEVPFLLIDYPNMEHSFSSSELDDLLNEIGYSGTQGQTGSFKDFYIENSYGQLVVNSTVLGWFTAAENYQVYGSAQGDSGYEMVKQMIGQAIDEAEAAGMDWTQFDNDGDGYLDALNVIHAGSGAEEGNSSYIWSHKWSLGSETRVYDGITISNYTINPEKQSLGYNGNPGMVHIGVISHEFGHALGLPDLYDIDYSSSGIGRWGVMSGGSWGGNGGSPWYPVHFSAWCKTTLGWVEPTVITEGSVSITLDNVEENPAIYRMNGEESGSEYFLFENRQAVGFDQNIINSGLLIWHIDDSIGGGNSDNSNDWHRRVDLEQADGNFSLNNNADSGSTDDPWPGSGNKTYFGFDTVPNSGYYSGNPSGISVVNISENNQLITATFRNLPNLALNTTYFDEISGDFDDVPNPGETHNIDIEFFNPSSDPIYDLEMFVNTDSPYIAIGNSESTLDDVDSYGLTVTNQSIGVSIDENAPLETAYIELYFTGVLENNTVYDQYILLPIDIRLDQKGFPLDIGANILSSPAILDIDSDGSDDIVFADDSGLVKAVSSSGEIIMDFDIDTEDEVWGAPAVGDVDNDGEDEIVVVSKSKHLLVISKDGEIELDFDADQYLVGTPSIGNLDEDDDLEIVFGGMSPSGKLFAINPDGSSLDNFPIDINEQMFSGASLADINSDNELDIIITTKAKNVHVINGSGESLSGFPFESSRDIRSAPLVVDIDSDGEFEILFGNDDGVFYCLSPEGEVEFEFQSSEGGFIRSTPSVQVNENDAHIYFGTTEGELVSINQNGELRDGFPVQFNESIMTSPVFSDLNSDGLYEVIVVAEGINVLSGNGDMINSFPLKSGETSSCSPIVIDIDQDNDLELIYGYSSGISIIDIKSEGVELDWNIYRGNFERTGVTDSNYGIVSGDINSDGIVDVIDVIQMVNIIMNSIDPTPYQEITSDLNIDQSIDIFDIILLINLILG